MRTASGRQGSMAVLFTVSLLACEDGTPYLPDGIWNTYVPVPEMMSLYMSAGVSIAICGSPEFENALGQMDGLLIPVLMTLEGSAREQIVSYFRCEIQATNCEQVTACRSFLGINTIPISGPCVDKCDGGKAVQCPYYEEATVAYVVDCLKWAGGKSGPYGCYVHNGHARCGEGYCDEEWSEVCEGNVVVRCRKFSKSTQDCSTIGKKCVDGICEPKECSFAGDRCDGPCWSLCNDGNLFQFDCRQLHPDMVCSDDVEDAACTKGGEDECARGIVKKDKGFYGCYEGKLFPIDCSHHVDWCLKFVK